MRKILLLSIALTMFSCASGDDSVVNSSVENEGKTIDTTINYKSPYNYRKGLYLEQNYIKYNFVNGTNVDFEVVPYFGLAYNIEGYYSTPSGMPNLGANGQVFGNYMAAEKIKLAPGGVNIIEGTYAVPNNLNNNGLGYFDFSAYPSISIGEVAELGKRGKLFYVEFAVDGSPILGKVKLPIKYDFNTNNLGVLPYPWQKLGLSDNTLGEELIFNVESLEVCSTIIDGGTYMDYSRFTYNGRNYYLKVYMNDDNIDVVLKEI
ncbi:hypothetical protein [Myroides sp. WP-1]|uniref:hypothetical protein n=1 Tax=Myroides sp. WP-1 TaxID=2759944 RepID=UPI0015F9D67B|nr:hypothetical protein [Myroides sp. WP-1]MBB1138952.1 hypothetical protein [Myroides sp. WP-1]